ncbi:uncharacterized protein LOC118485928 [Helianthus annuus]|uniref:uncharacterized protein LOC118485928 n=1 Tax=Helianthus annuus TaxID=4232 RepID=UPI00165322EB|nr:uncharacterized protein LOC118485928 [Helianthus annuus]
MVYADKGNGAKWSFSTLEPWMLETMTIESCVEDLHLTTDPLIISVAVGDYNMRRILVDTGSSEDIIYEHCFNRMQPEDRRLLESVHAPIKGFIGEKVDPIGQITFPVTFGCHILYSAGVHEVLNPAGYNNGISGQTGRSIGHQKIGPTSAIGPKRWVLSTHHPEQTVTIGDSLSPEVKNNLKQLLRRNANIFAFEHSDMTGIPRDKAEHKLATLPGIKPATHGKRSMAPDRKAAVVKEV